MRGNEHLSEAEIQALIAMIELEHPIETQNNNFYHFYPQTLEEAAVYFRSLRQDWSEAYLFLLEKGLLGQDKDGYALTPQGCLAAEQARAGRPPIWYWYQEYYTLTARSRAYSEFCERLYGKDLCQANFSDLQQLHKLAQILDLKPGQHILDVGCGRGAIAEYLSDETGAAFTGIDYSPEAVRQAQKRTEAKRARLDFQVMDMDHLYFPPGKFDAVISIDTLYMPADLEATLLKLVELLKLDGQMGIFYQHMLWEPGADREALRPNSTPLGAALIKAGLAFCTRDFTEVTYRHLQQKHDLGQELKGAFEAEETLALYEYIMMESESSTEPFDPVKVNFARYLYHVQL